MSKLDAQSTPASPALPARSLPAHWRRGRQLAVFVTLALVAVTTFLLRSIGPADRLDSWWLRARFTLRELIRPSKPDPDIVLVTIDNKSLEELKEPFILWGPHLANAINYFTRSGARVIALDWLQPTRSEEWFTGDNKALAPFFAKNDEKLAQALNQARSVVMVKELVSAQIGQKIKWNMPNMELLFSLPDSYPDPMKNLGYAEFNEKESIVAAIAPVVPGDTKEAGFAARIAEHYLAGEGIVKDNTWTISSKSPSRPATPLRSDGSLLINYHIPPTREYSSVAWMLRTGMQRDSDSLREYRSTVGGESDYAGVSGAFVTYSLSDFVHPGLGAYIRRDEKPSETFKDKIVIIGASFSGSNEQHYVPFLKGLKTRAIPGMEIHAHLVRTLLDGRPIREPNPLALWLIAIVPGLLGILAFTRLSWVPAAVVALLTAIIWIALSLALFIYSDYAMPVGLPLIGLLLGAGGMGAYRAFGEERERQQVMGLWGRYQDPRQVEYLLQHPKARGGEGQEAPVTVLFADLKNFTKTVEHLSPSEALQVLNRYLALMTDVIRDEYGGFVDKYLGDGLMAQWGAPPPWKSGREGEDHATTAVRACLELERRTRELTKSIAGAKDVTFGLRLTLHTGPVVVGWVGASRLEFTIIGDTVNVASRLQETAKELNCEFLISETTYASVEEWVRIGQRTEVIIRGREKPLRVYEILGEEPQAD